MRKLRTFLAALLIVGLVGPLRADTLTVYPDAGTGATTCDSIIRSTNAVWATARGASSGTASPTSAYDHYRSHFYAAEYIIDRIGLTFDTSALGGGASISATVMSLYATPDYLSLSTNHANPQVVSFTPATNNSIVGDDFDQFGATGFCDSPPLLATFATGGYKDFTFNATGIAAVSATGVTRVGVRATNDINNTAPDERSYAQIYFADQVGTANDPKLVVTYTTGSTFVPKIITVSSTTIPHYWLTSPYNAELTNADY